MGAGKDRLKALVVSQAKHIVKSGKKIVSLKELIKDRQDEVDYQVSQRQKAVDELEAAKEKFGGAVNELRNARITINYVLDNYGDEIPQNILEETKVMIDKIDRITGV